LEIFAENTLQCGCYIVNGQIGIKDSKFLVVSSPLPTSHATQRMRNDHFRVYNGA